MSSTPEGPSASRRRAAAHEGLRVAGVHFAYEPSSPVLEDVHLDVRPGEIFGLLGANGAGKTTLFRLLAGLLWADRGTLMVAGHRVPEDIRAAKAASAYVPDEDLLYPSLNALENMNLFGLLWGLDGSTIPVRTRELLEQVGLWERRKDLVRSYSSGMRQKLAICAGLLHRPTVLLMDEPFRGLDITASLWARGLLRRFANDGGAVLFTSHTPEVVEALSDRAAVLHGGRIGRVVDRSGLQAEGGAVAFYGRETGTGP